MSDRSTERIVPQRRSQPAVCPPPSVPGGASKRIIDGTPGGEKKKSEGALRIIAAEKQFLLKTLRSSLGNISLACLKANISRTKFTRYVDEDPAFAEGVIEVKEMAVDFAEGCLFKQMRNGSTAAAIFYLKTQGRHRGYIERIRHELPDAPDVSAPITAQSIEEEVPDESMDEIFDVIAEGVAAQKRFIEKRKADALRAAAEKAKAMPPSGPRLITVKSKAGVGG